MLIFHVNIINTYTIKPKIYTTLQYRILQYLTLYKPPRSKI